MIYLSHPTTASIQGIDSRRTGEARRRYKKGEMPLGSYMMGCAVVLIGDAPVGKTGSYKRGPIGTGFFVRVESENITDAHYGYLLTCWHVVEDQNHIELKIPRLDDPTQYYPTVDAPEFKQPVTRLDLGIAEFAPPAGYTITTAQLGYNLLERLEPDTLLAETFHYLGYLDYPEPEGLVMARSGTLGRVDEMLPDGEYKYRTHIGDVRSYDGFSGSPCFVEYMLPVLTPQPPPIALGTDAPVGRMGYLHLLCGMFTGHLDKRAPGGPVSRHGVGFILSSDEIWSVLMSDELRRERRKQDEAGAPEDVRTRTSVGDAGNEEFDNFEALTRRLVQVQPVSEQPDP